MGKTLFERYTEALEAYMEKQREAMEEENSTNLFDQLSERIEAEDLQLMRNEETDLYFVATPAGVVISEEMDLDEIEDWLENPMFIFPENLDIED